MNVTTYLLKNGFDKQIINTVLEAKKYKRLFPTKKRNECKAINLDIAYNLYVTYKLPFYKIGMLYGISDGYIRKKLEEKYNIFNRKHYCGVNSQNDYFENINSFDKAYFLGFIFADGAIIKNKKSYTLRIEIIKDDKYILEKFLKYSNMFGKIKDCKKRSTCYLSICSTKVCMDLQKYNIIQNKSHLDPAMPDISSEFIDHFIRGYFDGDGIAFTKPHIGFCGSKSIITFIRNRFVNVYHLNSNNITYNKTSHIYYVQWSRSKDVKTFYNIIYKNKEDLFLIRKYNKIKNNLAPIYGDI